MVNIVKECLHEESYSLDEICTTLETCIEFLHETSFTPNSKGVISFKLYQRATHVFEGK